MVMYTTTINEMSYEGYSSRQKLAYCAFIKLTSLLFGMQFYRNIFPAYLIGGLHIRIKIKAL